jgi:tRNA threonylcarbamoyladenosine biosynthesis protein TsaB
MKILALEFSGAQRSAALWDTDTARLVGSAVEAGGRQMKALAMVRQILDQSGSTRESIGSIAVGLGPGSYTGIRAAISLAQGWQLARATRVQGLSSIEVLARAAQAERIHGSVHIVVDAQRNEYYMARYEISDEGIREIDPLKLVPAVQVRQLAEAGATLVGPEAGALPGGRILFPDARVLARMAADTQQSVPGEALEPIYLRETTFVKAPPSRLIPE